MKTKTKKISRILFDTVKKGKKTMGKLSHALKQSVKTKHFEEVENAVAIIVKERTKTDRWFSCKELSDEGICKCLKKHRVRTNKRLVDIYRCNAKNKQPISSAYRIRPSWCPLLKGQI